MFQLFFIHLPLHLHLGRHTNQTTKTMASNLNYFPNLKKYREGPFAWRYLRPGQLMTLDPNANLGHRCYGNEARFTKGLSHICARDVDFGANRIHHGQPIMITTQRPVI